MIALALLLAQVTAAAPAPASTAAKPARPAPPQHMSILVDPCASNTADNGKDVVVCGRPDAISPRLPLRDERQPDGAAPANPEATGMGALAVEGAPCAVRGCYVGFGQPLVAEAVNGIGKAIKDIKDGRARRRDGNRRVAIDLDGPPPPIQADALKP